MATIYTIGHSNTPAETMIGQLRDAGVYVLVDIRRYPASRRWPQFNRDRLADALAAAGIGYRHAEALGGRRTPRGDSENGGLTNDQFRGYADYMGAPEFQEAMNALVTLAATATTAVMCAEALPWKCHRSLLGDVLVAQGHNVVHLYGGTQQQHQLTPIARLEGGRVTYPALL